MLTFEGTRLQRCLTLRFVEHYLETFRFRYICQVTRQEHLMKRIFKKMDIQCDAIKWEQFLRRFRLEQL